MKKEVSLNSNLVNKIEFTDNVFAGLFFKTMIPVFGVITTASIVAAVSFNNASFVFGIIVAALSGFVSGLLVDGRFQRRKIRRFARSKGIKLNKSDKRILLRAMKNCIDENLLLGDNKNLDVSTVWNQETINVNVKFHQNDEFSEAFGNALTINNDDLVAHFDMSKKTELPNETPFQKGINGRVNQLNRIVSENSKGTYIPYRVITKGDNIDIDFHTVGTLKKSFSALASTCEKDLLERLESQYPAK